MKSNNMKNELVTFETAKLAKEKGFNVPTETHYELSLTESIHEEDGKSGPFGWEKGELNCQSGYFINNWKETDYSGKSWYQCSAPTQSLLQKWLREKHGIEIQIFVMGIFMDKSTSPHSDFKLAKGFKKYEYGLNANKPNLNMGFDTYEEALEQGLYDSLKLIK